MQDRIMYRGTAMKSVQQDGVVLRAAVAAESAALCIRRNSALKHEGQEHEHGLGEARHPSRV